MPKFILVSFCNLPTITTSPLLCLQVPEKLDDGPISCAPVFLGYPELIGSATGLTRSQGRIYVLYSSRWSTFHIAAFKEENLSPLFYQEFPEIKDGHSILALDDHLYVVSTGTDEIICYDIKEKCFENPRIIWQASDTKTDTHHINSIVEKKGEILISAFGPKTGELWATASNGYIYNITTNSRIADGIHHPHSLSIKNDEIYYSDSHKNSFCVVGQANTIFDLNGYTRGISWLSSDLVCVATSIGRRISKSTGLVANPADPGELAGECGLLLLDISNKNIVRKIDLSSFGPEVYDVLLLEEDQIDLIALSNASQKSERDAIKLLSRELIEHKQQMQMLTAQVVENEQVVQALTEQVAERSAQVANIDAQLNAVYASRSWRITAPVRALGTKLGPMKRRAGGARTIDRFDAPISNDPLIYAENGRLKIAAVTMVYNEALILPYFLRHYSYLDEIHVLYETDSTDESLEILEQAANVVIEKCHIEGGLDDIEKINIINKTVQRVKASWVYVVDPDEFVFPPNHESPHDFLKRQSCSVVRSGMYQVYRHRNDRDLDPSLAPVPQRAHGDPNLFSIHNQANRASNSVYIKPNIVRPSKRIRFLPGHHQIEGNPQTSPELYVGAHWQMAEPSFAIARRMERKARISKRNKAHQMGWQHFDVSADKIKEECERHLDDPIIDALYSFSEVSVQNFPSGTGSDDLLQGGESFNDKSEGTDLASNERHNR